MKKFMNNFAEWIEKNPSLKLNPNDGADQSAYTALDEAIAACSSALVDEKSKGLTAGRTWYYGFGAANELAPEIYRLINEYMNDKKTLDDDFFAKLNENTQDLFKTNPQETNNKVSERLESTERETKKPSVSDVMQHIKLLRTADKTNLWITNKTNTPPFKQYHVSKENLQHAQKFNRPR